MYGDTKPFCTQQTAGATAHAHTFFIYHRYDAAQYLGYNFYIFIDMNQPSANAYNNYSVSLLVLVSP